MSGIDPNLQLTMRTLWKWLILKGLSVIYASVVRVWLLAYRIGIKKSRSVQSAVLSIGNITTGGTGKTPMVGWILDYCHSEGIKAGVLTRGYGVKRKATILILNSVSANQGNSEIFGDEPWMIFHNHPQSSIYISSDRFKAAELASNEVDLLVMDDGMQHLRLQRDLNIVLIDASTSLGNHQLFPLGPLREPLLSLKRADVVIYTKTNLAQPASLKELLQPYLADGVAQFESEFKPVGLVPFDNQSSIACEEILGKRCFLFSGVGNPASFEKIVQQAGGVVINHTMLPDHFRYGEDSIRRIVEIADNVDYDFLICTEKDWTKLESWREKLPEGWYLKMEMTIDSGFRSFLDDWIKESLTGRAL